MVCTEADVRAVPWRSMLLAMAASACLAAPALAQVPGSEPCGSITNAFGPFDYRTDTDKRYIVESHHFTAQVETLIRGQENYIGGDLDYTLRAFPNHHRALLAMMRYGDKLKTDMVPSAKYTVECYFIRALQFRRDDTTARMLYATYLNSKQRRSEALQHLAIAKSYAGENAFTHYNIGMMYMDLGEPGLALEQAHEALAMGFARPELKERLMAANKWSDPASAPR